MAVGVGVGVGVLTVIVMLASSLPLDAAGAQLHRARCRPRSRTPVSLASEGGSTNRVPEHWLLLPNTAVESEAKPSQGARPAGSQLALTVVDPPTSIVV